MTDIQDYEQYVVALILECAQSNAKEGKWSVFQDVIAQSVKDKFLGFASEDSISKALAIMQDAGIVEITSSPLTGDWVEISPYQARRLFDDTLPPQSTNQQKNKNIYTKKYPIIHTYYKAGSEWIDRVTSALEFQGEQKSAIQDSGEAPASNRIVTLKHNQRVELEQPLDEIVKLVESENAINGEDGLRELVIGRLRAGRELIRAGVFSIQSLQLTLIIGLKILTEKYGDTAIAITAAKLLDLLLKQYGIG